MMEGTCILCGKFSNKISFSKGLCLDCFLHENLIEKIKEVKLTICPSCFSYWDNGWKKVKSSKELVNFILKRLERSIYLKEGVEIDELDIKVDFDNMKSGIMFLKVFLTEFDEFYEITKDIDIQVKKKLCNSCLKYKIEDYDAIIQLRSRNHNLVREFDLETESKYQNTNIIVKKEIYNYGIDVYFINLSEARRFAKNFGKRYNLKIKESFSLKKGAKKRYTILLS
jgi:NMD protein affecting ribosome stability and mRNA decay